MAAGNKPPRGAVPYVMVIIRAPMKSVLAVVLVCVPLLAAAGVHAGDRSTVPAQLAGKLGLKPADVTLSPIPGLYRIIIGPQVAYVSADGRYLIHGEIIDLHDGSNLTQPQRAAARLDYLKRLGDADMIVFAPPHPRRTITVLTDIDCEYCRQLEHDRPTLNAMGIAVRYLFFPRAGIGSSSWDKAVSVWCAKDRKAAFTAAMQGHPPPSASCDQAPVAAGYRFGELLGLDGTPAIITDKGQLIDGYLPVRELASALDLATPPAPNAVH